MCLVSQSWKIRRCSIELRRHGHLFIVIVAYNRSARRIYVSVIFCRWSAQKENESSFDGIQGPQRRGDLHSGPAGCGYYLFESQGNPNPVSAPQTITTPFAVRAG